MKHAAIALFAGISLMACSPTSEPTPTPGPVASAPVEPEPAPADTCGAAQYAALVGKLITDPGVPAEGPNVRYIRPGTQVTMDYRADRLNIDIDAADVITGFRCT